MLRLQMVITGVRGFDKGLEGGGLQLTNPQKQPAQKLLQKCVPLLQRGHRKKGVEKGLQFLA